MLCCKGGLGHWLGTAASVSANFCVCALLAAWTACVAESADLGTC